MIFSGVRSAGSVRYLGRFIPEPIVRNERFRGTYPVSRDASRISQVQMGVNFSKGGRPFRTLTRTTIIH
jgi:hypothetical protein